MNLQAILGLYLAFGATYVAAAMLWVKLRAGTAPANGGMKESLAFRIGMPLVVFVVAAVVWPLLIVHQVREKWFSPAEKFDDPFFDEPFSVREPDLVQPLSLDEIEARERVHDPLCAVPPEPFGHLHHAWAAFKATLPRDAVLSSFLAIRPARYGEGHEHFAGYASMRDGRIEHWFIATRVSRRPDDEDGTALIRRYARIADVPTFAPNPTIEGDPNDEAGT